MNISDSSVFVTGGAGFIGSHLVEELLSQGAEVTVFDNLSTGQAEYVSEEATFIEGNLRDESALQTALTDDVDLVIHLASCSSVNTDSPRKDCIANLEMTYTLLERMRDVGLSKIVFASSSTVYGEASVPTPESHAPLEPISSYGASKFACEGVLSTYAHSYGFTVWNLRFANVVGSRLRDAVIPDFIEKLQAESDHLKILGNGKQEKSYIHITDCINAMMFLVENTDAPMNTYNLGTDGTTSVNTIAKIVCQVLDVAPEFEYTGGERGWTGDIPRTYLSIAKLHDEGFSPRLGSDAAVKRAATEIFDEI